ncbi:MAG: SpoIIE family protein phosphatase [Bacteroidetes bacterium]|nr:SpoIIE family protein phosphatase [Bacteroidota bacterium]
MFTFVRSIVNTGVTPDLPFKQQNRIRIFNSSSLVIAFICTAYTIIGYLNHYYIATALTLTELGGTIFSIAMMKWRNYRISFHLTLILGMIFLATFSLLYGETGQTHIFLLFMPMGAVIVFDNFKVIFTYFFAAIAVIIALKVTFNSPSYKSYYPFDPLNNIFGIMNTGFTGLLIFLGVKMFKTENVAFNEKVETQRLQLEERNKDILDSIHYAKRIQRALLASDTMLRNNLPEYFVFYRPKDIVSGDFYWADESPDGKFLLLTGDCTGHGVPGAFMSLLNISILHELTNGLKMTKPDELLNTQRKAIIMALNPEGADEESKDGMDCVLCSFDLKNNRVEFSCANNPLWILRNGEMMEFKADKQPVGMHEGIAINYTLHTTDLRKGDIIYTFTDGFADQFGGPRGKKFKYAQLKEKLLAMKNEKLALQKEQLSEIFEEWKGELEQLDDVLVIGIRI